jgi:hypothetical protein
MKTTIDNEDDGVKEEGDVKEEDGVKEEDDDNGRERYLYIRIRNNKRFLELAYPAVVFLERAGRRKDEGWAGGRAGRQAGRKEGQVELAAKMKDKNKNRYWGGRERETQENDRLPPSTTTMLTVCTHTSPHL